MSIHQGGNSQTDVEQILPQAKNVTKKSHGSCFEADVMYIYMTVECV